MQNSFSSCFGLLLFLLLSAGLYAQPGDCLFYDAIEFGTVFTDDGGYEAGDLISTENYVRTYLENYTDNNGNSGFFYAGFFSNNDDNVPDDKDILLQGGSLRWDFTGIPNNDYASGLCFTISTGTVLNLGINGTTFIFDSPLDVPEQPELWPGVTEMDITTFPNNPFLVQFCFNGEIEELIIGHGESWIYNLCYGLLNEVPDCELNDLVLELGDCDDGLANLYLDFEAFGTQEVGFDVQLNGNFYGFYSYEELPLVLTVSDDDVDADELTVTVCENDNDGCCIEETILWESCGPICGISDINVSQQPCDENGNYSIWVDYDYIDPAVNDQLIAYVHINDAFSDTIAIDSVPLILGPYAAPDTGDVDVVVVELVLIGDNGDVCVINGLTKVYPCEDYCEDFEAELVSAECLGPLQALIEYSVSPQVVDGSFTVSRNGEIIDQYDYGASSYFSDFFTADTLDFITITDDSTGCTATFEYAHLCDPCEILGFTAQPSACFDDSLYITISFEYTGEFTEGFTYSIAGMTGNFDYTTAPFEIGPFAPTNELETLIIWAPGVACSANTQVFLSCQQDCILDDLVVESSACDQNGNYTLTIDFFTNQPNELFVVTNDATGDSLLINPSQLPVSFNLNFFQIQTSVIRVFAQNIDCGVLEELFVQTCSIQDCFIEGASVDVVECNPNDGTYGLLVDFETNAIDEEFYVELVKSDGSIALIDTANTQNLPLVIYPIDANDCPFGFVRIYTTNPDCPVVELDFVALDCVGGPDCEVENATVEVVECDPNFGYGLLVDFEVSDTLADLFLVEVRTDNGTIIYSESVTGADTPVFFYPIDGNDVQSGYIRIVPSNGDCEVVEVAWESDCVPSNECAVIEPSVEVIECDPNFGYGLRVNFDALNPNQQYLVEVKENVNTVLYSQVVTVEDLPVIFYPINGNEVQSGYVRIVPLNSNCDVVELDWVSDCVPNNCDLNPTYSILYEDGADSYSILLITNGDPSVDSILVSVINNEGEVLGFYASEPGIPMFLGPFSTLNGCSGIILIETLGFSNCGAFTLDYGFDCNFNEDCVTDAVVEVECLGDGEYELYVDFEEGDSINYLIQVFLPNGQLWDQANVLGEFLPFSFGPYLSSEVDNGTVAITIPGSNCPQYFVDFLVECSSTECNFTEVFAEAHPCDDGQFLIDFEFNNPGAQGTFLAFVNGELFGPFDYGQTFYTVGPFDSGEASYDITLIDSGDPTCFGFYSLEPPVCSDECTILEVFAFPTDCNEQGEFFVLIEIEAVNTGSSYTIVGNGNNYGVFNYTDGSVELGPFAADGETSYEFVVIDLSTPSCSNFAEIEPQTCFECVINQVSYEIECDIDAFTGKLTIDIIHDFDDEQEFLVYIGDVLIDDFSFGDLPVSVNRNYNVLSAGDVLRVEIPGEDCVHEIPYELPCCYLEWGNDWVSASECESNGEFYAELILVQPPFNGSDSVVVTYGPVGGTIIATATIAYDDFPTEIGPLPGNGDTDFFFIASDQDQECVATAELPAITCNNGSCIEFEGLTQTFYGPNTGYEDGDIIDTEDDVTISYQDHPDSDCSCFVFGFNSAGVPAFINGAGLTAMTDESGIGLDFADLGGVSELAIDYYFAGTSMSISINGSDLISVDQLATDTDHEVLAGIILNYSSISIGDGTTGTILLTGDIETIELYSIGIAVFDNICHGNADPDLVSDCLDFAPLVEEPGDTLILVPHQEDVDLIYEEDGISIFDGGQVVYQGNSSKSEVIFTEQDFFDIGSPGLSVARNVIFDFSEAGGVASFSFNFYTFPFSYVNIRVNDGDLIEAADFTDLPTNIAPGVTLTVDFEPGSDRRGRATFAGDIGSLTIGGAPLSMAEFCWELDEEEVWPGDVNIDNIADLYDVLNIGVGYGSEGPARSIPGSDWQAQTAANWEEFFVDGNNYKHADANGDGIIDEGDILVIEDNYELTHGEIVPFEALPATDIDPAIFIDLTDIGTPQAGAEVLIPIVLGTEDQPVEDIYGVAFRLEFAVDAFQFSSLELEIPTSWLGEPDVNMLTFERLNEQENVWDITLVRNDHNNVSGYGPIVYLRGIIDDIAGISQEEVDLDFGSIAAIEDNGYPMPIRRLGNQFVVSTGPVTPDKKIRIYPNPTQGELIIEGPESEIPPFAKIYGVDSRFLGNYDIRGGRIDLSHLPGGVYILELDRGILRTVERIVIAK